MYILIDFTQTGHEIQAYGAQFTTPTDIFGLETATAHVYTGATDEYSPDYYNYVISTPNTWTPSDLVLKSPVTLKATRNGLIYIQITGAYTVKLTDNIINVTSGTFSITLPDATSCPVQAFSFKNSGSGTITVASVSSQTINGGGATSKTLAPNDTLSIESNGTNWLISIAPNTGIGSLTTTGSSGAATYNASTKVLNIPNYTVIPYTNLAGSPISITKVAMGVVSSLGTTNGYSIDISGASFTNVLSYQIIAIRNTGTVSSSPNVSVKTVSNTAIVVNITETNTATVTILGISVLSGLPVIFAATSGLSLEVIVWGN